MKKIVLMLIAILIVGSGLIAQIGLSQKTQKKEMTSTDTSLRCGFIGFSQNGDSLFRSVQIEAEFPGGGSGWRNYLEQNLNTRLGGKYIKIPKGDASAKATVIVNFLIDKEGNISEVTADSLSIVTIHKKIVAEAIRVIKEGPKWKPAWQCGKNVAYRARQSITWIATND